MTWYYGQCKNDSTQYGFYKSSSECVSGKYKVITDAKYNELMAQCDCTHTIGHDEEGNPEIVEITPVETYPWVKPNPATANKVVVLDTNGQAKVSTIGTTQLSQLSGIKTTSTIQSQIDALSLAIQGGGIVPILDKDLALVSSGAGAVTTSDITSTELGYLDGVTSNIQTQIDTKQAKITGGATTILSNNLTKNMALISNSSGKVAVSPNISSTELDYLDGVTSNIQTQLNGKQGTVTGGASTILSSNLDTSKILVSNSSGKVSASSVASSKLDKLQYLDNVTSDVQTQINGKQDAISGLTGNKAVVTDANGKISESTVTATQIGYLSNVASDVMTLINARATKSHASEGTGYGLSTDKKYGHAKASSTTPLADGTASVGSETASFARGDHIHPTDTTRASVTDLNALQTTVTGKAPNNHANANTTYGVASATLYGHAKSGNDTPKVNGTASAGTVVGTYARVDHIHPTDTTRASAEDLNSHIADVDNPHGVTKKQIGLEFVDNTKDVDKPISTATQTALNAKANDGVVVKLEGDQTIYNKKTFKNNLYITEGDERGLIVKRSNHAYDESSWYRYKWDRAYDKNDSLVGETWVASNSSYTESGIGSCRTINGTKTEAMVKVYQRADGSAYATAPYRTENTSTADIVTVGYLQTKGYVPNGIDASYLTTNGYVNTSYLSTNGYVTNTDLTTNGYAKKIAIVPTISSGKVTITGLTEGDVIHCTVKLDGMSGYEPVTFVYDGTQVSKQVYSSYNGLTSVTVYTVRILTDGTIDATKTTYKSGSSAIPSDVNITSLTGYIIR